MDAQSDVPNGLTTMLGTARADLVDHQQWVVGVVVAVVVIAFVLRWRGQVALRLRNTARRLRPTPLDELEEGTLVRVTGRVVAHDDMVHAPLLQRPSVIVETVMTTTVKGALGASTQTIVERTTHAPCTISDQRGLVRIEIDDARCFLDDATVIEGALDAAKAPLRDAAQSQFGVRAESGVRYRERAICAGDAVSVVGTARRRENHFYLTAGVVPLTLAAGKAPALTQALTRRAIAYHVVAGVLMGTAMALIAMLITGQAP